jgi:hypothetical protein
LQLSEFEVHVQRRNPMPRGRKANPETKIAQLLSQLREALLARESARIEATVAAQMDRLAASISKGGVDSAGARPSKPSPALTRKRRSWTPAARAAARQRMKKYWAARRAKTGKLRSARSSQ